ncbi:MAG TPA: M48 family metalloprotease [Myxococcota bacterium]|nr:M48 family metalloprotease [Myxococcota bacterium]
MLLTEVDDVRVGGQAAEAVAADMGLYADPKLEAYVNEVGQSLLRGVPRMGFQYQFKLVDQSEPNAFALPGGYIFVSRGLLALVGSEDELANVLGHEITHVARRHGAMQQALAEAGPLAMPWIRAASQAAYGRDMENEADQGGQLLAAAAGYDPMAMSTFMRKLDHLERIRIGGVRQTRFVDTHPGSSERAAVNAARSHEIRRRQVAGRGGEPRLYLQRIEGLPVGPRPETGVFVGDIFLHPAMDFQLRFPAGWSVANTNRAVGAVSPRRDAMIYLTAAQQRELDPEQAALAFAVETSQTLPVEVVRSEPVKVAGIDAWRLQLDGSARGGSVQANVTFIPYRGAMYRITGVSSRIAARDYAGRMLATARSFRPLLERERAMIDEVRLRIEATRAGEDLAALSRRAGSSWSLAEIAVYNGLFTTHRFQGGELVKTARRERIDRDASSR